jgi:hypothetical protein
MVSKQNLNITQSFYLIHGLHMELETQPAELNIK